MSATVKIGKAKTTLSSLISRAEAGEEIVIARGDKPVVKLVALNRAARLREVIDTIREERKRYKPWTQAEIRAAIEEGRE